MVKKKNKTRTGTGTGDTQRQTDPGPGPPEIPGALQQDQHPNPPEDRGSDGVVDDSEPDRQADRTATSLSGDRLARATTDEQEGPRDDEEDERVSRTEIIDTPRRRPIITYATPSRTLASEFQRASLRSPSQPQSNLGGSIQRISSRRSSASPASTPSEQSRVEGPALFRDTLIERQIDFEPFSDLRARLARYKRACYAGILTDDDYILHVHELMSQAERCYEAMQQEREQRREQKRPATDGSPAKGPNRDRTSPSDVQGTEEEMVRTAQEQSRRQYQEDQRARSKPGEGSGQARVVEAEAASRRLDAKANASRVDITSTANVADGEYTSDSNLDAPRNTKAVEPWYVPDYPERQGESELEKAYRSYLSRFRELHSVAELITQFHEREIKLKQALVDLRGERETTRSCG